MAPQNEANPEIKREGRTWFVTLPMEVGQVINAKRQPAIAYVIRLRQAGTEPWSFGFETPTGPAATVEVHAPAPALEELGVEMLLQGADAVADGGGGDLEFLAGEHEALVAGGGLEEAQAVERGQVEDGDGPKGARW